MRAHVIIVLSTNDIDLNLTKNMEEMYVYVCLRIGLVINRKFTETLFWMTITTIPTATIT